MPLDKVLVSHLDEMDKIEDALDEMTEKLISSINIDAVLASPETVMSDVVMAVENMMDDSFYKQAAQNGLEFAFAIEKDGDIKIQRTDDPNANEPK
jgi:hypothetical protein